MGYTLLCVLNLHCFKCVRTYNQSSEKSLHQFVDHRLYTKNVTLKSMVVEFTSGRIHIALIPMEEMALIGRFHDQEGPEPMSG